MTELEIGIDENCQRFVFYKEWYARHSTEETHAGPEAVSSTWWKRSVMFRLGVASHSCVVRRGRSLFEQKQKQPKDIANGPIILVVMKDSRSPRY